MPQQLCQVCNEWLPRGQPNWEKHNLSDKHQKCLRAAAQKKKKLEQDIFVTGYASNRNFSMDRLLNEFRKFGEVSNSFCGNRSQSFVIIQFKTRESAVAALNTPVFFDNTKLVVRPRMTRNRSADAIAPEPVVIDPATFVIGTEGTWEDQAQQLGHLLGIPRIAVPIGENPRLLAVCSNISQSLARSHPNCRSHVFGSQATGLAGPDSDVDIFVDLGQDPLHLSPQMKKLLETDPKLYNEEVFKNCVTSLRRSWSFDHVIGISRARIPVIKCVHKETNLQCDITYKSPLSVSNTDLLKYFFELDERVKLLMIVIKHWLKGLDLDLSNYALSMMAIFYLMTLDKPLVPTVLDLFKEVDDPYIFDGWQSTFLKIPFKSENNQTLKQLISGFFEFLVTYDFGVDVMCVLSGESVQKCRFLQPETLPESQITLKTAMENGKPLMSLKMPMCVQDPFETNHNITKALNFAKFVQLQARCKCAVEYCNSPEATLQGLFEAKPKPVIWTPTMPNIINILLVDFFPSDLPPMSDIRDVWLERSETVVLDVFKHVLQFEEVDKEDGTFSPPSKIQKMDSSHSTVVQFKSKFCLWNGRKKGKNMNKTPQNDSKEQIKLTAFLQEVETSLTLLKNCYPNPEVLKYCINVFCHVRRKKAPTSLEIEIINNKCEKNMIQPLTLFLSSHLQNLVNKGLSQDYKQDLEQLLVRKSSETRAQENVKVEPKESIKSESKKNVKVGPKQSPSRKVSAQSRLMKSIEEGGKVAAQDCKDVSEHKEDFWKDIPVNVDDHTDEDLASEGKADLLQPVMGSTHIVSKEKPDVETAEIECIDLEVAEINASELQAQTSGTHCCQVPLKTESQDGDLSIPSKCSRLEPDKISNSKGVPLLQSKLMRKAETSLSPQTVELLDALSSTSLSQEKTCESSASNC